MKPNTFTNTTLLTLLFTVLLLILTSCTPKECTTNTDCAKPHFTGICKTGTCAYIPKPNECGNNQCEPPENTCSCPTDCGPCTGKLGTHLTATCISNECLLDTTTSKPVFLSSEQTSQGDKIRTSLTINQPFNTNKHTAQLKIGITQENPRNTNRRIKTATLTALTQTKQTIVIAQQTLDKPLWTGYDLTEELQLNIPSTSPEGELNNFALTITYDYITEQAGREEQKTTTLTTRYNIKFTYANPPNTYPCQNCDDNNPGTSDTCIDGFCKHAPQPNTCGNFNCDNLENECTCPRDCGPCTGSGVFTQKTCQNNNCISQLKRGITQEPQTIFEDRNLNTFTLQNYYKYNQPFSIKDDTFTFETTLTKINPGISNINIEAVRLLEGNNEITAVVGTRTLPATGSKQTITLTIPPQTKPETEKTLTLAVWYSYNQNGQQQAQYTKPLGKITLLTT